MFLYKETSKTLKAQFGTWKYDFIWRLGISMVAVADGSLSPIWLGLVDESLLVCVHMSSLWWFCRWFQCLLLLMKVRVEFAYFVSGWNLMTSVGELLLVKFVWWSLLLVVLVVIFIDWWGLGVVDLWWLWLRMWCHADGVTSQWHWS